MTIEILDSDKFKEITLSVEEDLTRDLDYQCINVCSFTRRAYLLGAINALSTISSEKDINYFSVQVIMKALSSEATTLDKIIANEIEEMKNR